MTIGVTDVDQFFEAVGLDNITEAKAMLKANPKIVHALDEKGNNALAFARSKEMVSLLIEYGVNINARNIDAMTPLHAITFNIDECNDVIELLLWNGAEINATDSRGWTPLCLAADNGNIEAVKSLITHGADVNAVDNEEKTTLQIALEDDNPYSSEIASFLVDHGAQIRKIDQAIAVGDLSWVESYFNANPEFINLKNSYGLTPLYSSIYYGQIGIVEFLIRNGADVNSIDRWGETPLHYVAAHSPSSLESRKKIAEILISNRVDINIRDNKGYTPLALAVKNKKEDIADLLRKHGAKE